MCAVRIAYRVVGFVERAMTLRLLIPLSVLLLCLRATSGAQTSEQANGSVPPKEIRVTLMGDRERTPKVAGSAPNRD
jgi:hypothetical protein